MRAELIAQADVSDAKGTSITWGELGAGDPLVVIHGFQQSPRTWRRVALGSPKVFTS